MRRPKPRCTIPPYIRPTTTAVCHTAKYIHGFGASTSDNHAVVLVDSSSGSFGKEQPGRFKNTTIQQASSTTQGLTVVTADILVASSCWTRDA